MPPQFPCTPPCKLRLQSETCDRSGWHWLHRHHLGGGEAEHLHHVHLGLRHRQHGQLVPDRVRHRAVHRRRDTPGSDRQRARRVRSTVLRGG